MKPVIKTAVLVVCCILSFNCLAIYERFTFNGGPNGYNYVSKEVSGDRTCIQCYDPGFASCVFIVENGNQQEADLAIIAAQKIAQGVLTGRIVNNRYTCEWVSRASDGYNSTIIVY